MLSIHIRLIQHEDGRRKHEARAVSKTLDLQICPHNAPSSSFSALCFFQPHELLNINPVQHHSSQLRRSMHLVRRARLRQRR